MDLFGGKLYKVVYKDWFLKVVHSLTACHFHWVLFCANKCHRALLCHSLPTAVSDHAVYPAEEDLGGSVRNNGLYRPPLVLNTIHSFISHHSRLISLLYGKQTPGRLNFTAVRSKHCTSKKSLFRE